MYKMRFYHLLLFSLFVNISTAQVLDYSWASNGNQPGDFCDPVKTVFDQQGNAYLLVNFSEQVAFGTLNLIPLSANNLAVVCFNTSGIAIWSAIAGSSDGTKASAMDIDKDGNIIIGGWYTNSLALGGLNLAFESNDAQKQRHEFFLAKLNSSGQWQWARKQSGAAYSEIVSIGTDQSGNVFAGGVFLGEQLTIGSESLEPEEDLPFVIKYSASGQPLWLRGADTPFGATLTDLAVLPDGSVCFTGSYGTFEAESIDITLGSITLTNEGDPDLGYTSSNIYIALISPSGTFLWAKQAGSIIYESFSGSLVIDQTNIYLSGNFQEDITALGSAFSKTATGQEGDVDIFIASLDFSGNWHWLISAGTEEEDAAPVLLSTSDHILYVYGALGGLPLSLGTIELTATGQNTSYLARLLDDGNWSAAFTHPSLVDVAAKSGNNLLFTGKYTNTVQFDEFTLTATGTGDSPDVYLAAATYSTSIPESLKELSVSGLTVFPQPFDQTFSVITPEPGSWELLSIDGRRIRSGLAGRESSGPLLLNGSDLSGIYILRYKGESGRLYLQRVLAE